MVNETEDDPDPVINTTVDDEKETLPVWVFVMVPVLILLIVIIAFLFIRSREEEEEEDPMSDPDAFMNRYGSRAGENEE